MESKSNEIERLTEKLKQMDIQVGELKTEVVDLNENIDSLSTENTIKKEIIDIKEHGFNALGIYFDTPERINCFLKILNEIHQY